MRSSAFVLAVMGAFPAFTPASAPVDARSMPHAIAQATAPPPESPDWRRTLGVPVEPSLFDAAPNAALATATPDASLMRRCPDPPGATTLPQLLRCASAYVEEFEQAFSSVVAEERLEQVGQVSDFGRMNMRRRLTRADMLLVQDPSGYGWMPFRDVFEVDGRTLTDRQDRLRRLFTEHPESASRQGHVIAEESARYNLGGFHRTINVPTLTLLFLKPTNVGRFAIRKAGDETLGGVRVWKIEYQERTRPTFVKGDVGADLPARGTFWIDPRDGAVLASTIEFFTSRLSMKAVVTFAADAVPGLLVPVEMREAYRVLGSSSAVVNTLARYSRFRRFQVETEEAIKKD